MKRGGFLAASQDPDKRVMQTRLDAEEQAKQLLSEANHKANQRIRVGALALGLMLTGAIADLAFQIMVEGLHLAVRLPQFYFCPFALSGDCP